MRPRLALSWITAGVMTLLSAVPAWAEDADAWVDLDGRDDEVEVGAADGTSTGGSEGSGAAGRCSWSAVPAEDIGTVWWDAAPDFASGIENPSEYDWYWRSCPDGAGGSTPDLIPVAPGAPPVDPLVLRDEAIDRLRLPAPAVALNPPGDQVVHVASWLWIDDAIWRGHSRSVSAGGVTSTVRASPRRVTWDMGNGDTVVCDGPGTAYDPSRAAAEQSTDCSYTYVHSSAGQPGEAYQVTATVEWEVAWSVTGAGGGGPLPAMVTSAPVAARVAEMQALNQ